MERSLHFKLSHRVGSGSHWATVQSIPMAHLSWCHGLAMASATGHNGKMAKTVLGGHDAWGEGWGHAAAAITVALVCNTPGGILHTGTLHRTGVIPLSSEHKCPPKIQSKHQVFVGQGVGTCSDFMKLPYHLPKHKIPSPYKIQRGGSLQISTFWGRSPSCGPFKCTQPSPCVETQELWLLQAHQCGTICLAPLSQVQVENRSQLAIKIL